MGTLNGKMMNQARSESSIVQRTFTEEVSKYVIQYLACAQATGLPKSRHEGYLDGYGTIGRKDCVLMECWKEKQNCLY